MRLEFEIDADNLPPERIAEYGRLLNILLGVDAEWMLAQQQDIPDDFAAALNEKRSELYWDAPKTTP